MMYSAVLCEGNLDRILTSYYLIQVMGYEYLIPKRMKEYKLVNLHCNKNDYDWYKDAKNNFLVMAAVNGCDFTGMLKDIMELNKAQTADKAIQRIVVITDNDDITAQERLNTLQNTVELCGIKCQPFEANTWSSFGFNNAFGEVVDCEISILYQPMYGYGNLETFVLDTIAQADLEDREVVTAARKYIAGIKKDKYLSNRGDVNKAEMAAAFAVFNPTRLFEKFDNVFRGIKWEEYMGYNEQFCVLEELRDV